MRLVLGLGHADRGDDGIGPLVVRLLRPQLPADVRAREIGGDVTDLLESWQGFDPVICIDAALGAAPGEILRLTGAAPLPYRPGVSSHGFGLGESIALARALGVLPARLIVYAVTGTRFEIGAAMSDAARAACATVAERVLAEFPRP